METRNPWQALLEKYINEILEDRHFPISNPGPFISISRDFGSMAEPIAAALVHELSNLKGPDGKKHEWKWINKEILTESSKLLGLKPEQVKYVFMSGKKSMMEEVIGALSTRYYKNDKKIRNTIMEVIHKVAAGGYVIIVGRGGVAFGPKVPLSIHVKLQAPLEWRTSHVMKNYDKNHDAAIQHITEVDKERKFLIDSFFGYDTDLTIFDLVVNRKTVDESTTVNLIKELAIKQGLVTPG